MPECVGGAARGGHFCAVVQEPNAATAWVPKHLLPTKEELIHQDGAEEVDPASAWCPVRIGLPGSGRDGLKVPAGPSSAARVLEQLSRAVNGVRLLSPFGTEVLLVPERSLAKAANVLVGFGHAIWPSTRVIEVAPWDEASRKTIDPTLGQRLSGVWRLVHREEPPGTIVEEYTEGDGPVRVQASGGFFAEVRIISNASGDGGSEKQQFSFGGRVLPVEEEGGYVACTQLRTVDFQPPGVQMPRSQLTVGTQSIEVAGKSSEYRELWARVGSPDERNFVVLELQSEAPEQKLARSGLWVFVGQRFARIVGPRRGLGLVAGTCCQSLAQLQRLRGIMDVRYELREHFEAVYGVVEEPGLLRASRVAWSSQTADSIFFNANDDATGEIVVSRDSVMRILPGGGQESWRIVEWTFDPFTPPPPANTAAVTKTINGVASGVATSADDVAGGGDGGESRSTSQTRARSRSSEASQGAPCLDIDVNLGSCLRSPSRSPAVIPVKAKAAGLTFELDTVAEKEQEASYSRQKRRGGGQRASDGTRELDAVGGKVIGGAVTTDVADTPSTKLARGGSPAVIGDGDADGGGESKRKKRRRREKGDEAAEKAARKAERRSRKADVGGADPPETATASLQAASHDRSTSPLTGGGVNAASPIATPAKDKKKKPKKDKNKKAKTQELREEEQSRDAKVTHREDGASEAEEAQVLLSPSPQALAPQIAPLSPPVAISSPRELATPSPAAASGGCAGNVAMAAKAEVKPTREKNKKKKRKKSKKTRDERDEEDSSQAAEEMQIVSEERRSRSRGVRSTSPEALALSAPSPLKPPPQRDAGVVGAKRGGRDGAARRRTAAHASLSPSPDGCLTGALPADLSPPRRRKKASLKAAARLTQGPSPRRKSAPSSSPQPSRMARERSPSRKASQSQERRGRRATARIPPAPARSSSEPRGGRRRRGTGVGSGAGGYLRSSNRSPSGGVSPPKTRGVGGGVRAGSSPVRSGRGGRSLFVKGRSPPGRGGGGGRRSRTRSRSRSRSVVMARNRGHRSRSDKGGRGGAGGGGNRSRSRSHRVASRAKGGGGRSRSPPNRHNTNRSRSAERKKRRK
eukprot:TRINITY_DN62558_c0_g1_i1.p1 TRINITY_DN62558_c0_g1~~TRINITY_DN62558_c0_g1_i1.p1  ORF type:complete len:1194 (-),score=216.85 TRINITY_DN62558_c0_g1_i1:85-3360(-)